MKTSAQKIDRTERNAKIIGNIIITIVALAGAAYCIKGIYMHWVHVF